MRKVTSRDLVNGLMLTIQYGEEFLDRPIHTSELSRPGVELTGYFDFYDQRRIQVFGRTEISFIEQMNLEDAKKVLEKICSDTTPALIVSRRLEMPKVVVDAAMMAGIPILQASSKTTLVLSHITNFLEHKLAERATIHGVFLDVFGMGVLITGDSGVGKSETALELIRKGHRLVADDRIDLYQLDESTLIGESPDILRNLLEVRGIGIIDVMTLFGVGSVKENQKLELIIHLELYDKTKTFDRLGNNGEMVDIMDVSIPKISIPVKLGRNLANIVEVATMNFRAKNMGFNATATFENNLAKLIAKNTVKES